MSSTSHRTAPTQTSRTDPIQDVIRSIFVLPIELPLNGPEKFWLYGVKTEWVEAGRQCKQTELRSRCRDCNWGYNCGPYVTTTNLRRIGEATEGHGRTCVRIRLRTIDIMSGEIDPQV